MPDKNIKKGDAVRDAELMTQLLQNDAFTRYRDILRSNIVHYDELLHLTYIQYKQKYSGSLAEFNNFRDQCASMVVAFEYALALPSKKIDHANKIDDMERERKKKARAAQDLFDMMQI